MSNVDYPLISVIVPVYNAEKYLKKCVDSLLNQTYPNMEIILVNDGSKDNSLWLCEELGRKYNRIKVFSKTNGGQSTARNLGLEHASGDYIGFVDSDDWVYCDMYQTLFEGIVNNQGDIAQIETAVTDNPNYKRPSELSKESILVGKRNILRYYLASSTKSGSYSVCRCLIRADIAKKYRFREGKINEDIDYKYLVLRECKRFVIIDKICYCYYQSGLSTTSGALKKRDLDLFDAADILMRLTEEEEDENLRFLGRVKQARTPFSLLCRIAYYGIDSEFQDQKKIIKDLTKSHRKNLSILLKSPMPLNRKIIALALAIDIKCLSIPIYVIKKLK